MALLRTNHGRAFRASQQAHSQFFKPHDAQEITPPEIKAPHDAFRKSSPGRLQSLRAALSKIEAKSVRNSEAARPTSSLSFGIAEVDRCFPEAGLAAGAVHEVVASSHGDRPAGLGFAVALMGLARLTRPGVPVLVASRAALFDLGTLHGHGLHRLGVDLDRLILVEARTDIEALWALEETLRSGSGLSMVLGLVGSGTVRAGFGSAQQGKHSALADLTSSRRLALAAASTGTPLVLSLPHTIGATSAAATRWRIAAAPSPPMRATPNAEASFRRSRWRTRLERCRNGRTGEWIFEWDHVALRFSLARELAAHTSSARSAERDSGDGQILRFAS